jgi:hypothetical protein
MSRAHAHDHAHDPAGVADTHRLGEVGKGGEVGGRHLQTGPSEHQALEVRHAPSSGADVLLELGDAGNAWPILPSTDAPHAQVLHAIVLPLPGLLAHSAHGQHADAVELDVAP